MSRKGNCYDNAAMEAFWSTLKREAIAKSSLWSRNRVRRELFESITDRTDNIFRSVSAWLRALGWETGKTNHELRKYAGSQVAMRYGIYEAQCWLRHSTVKVTEQHYTTYVKRFKPSNVKTIPGRWATLEAPQLRIVPMPAAEQAG